MSRSEVGNERAWYHDSLEAFRATPLDSVLGQLSRHAAFAVRTEQRDAWREQIEFLKGRLDGLRGTVVLEFDIPRMGRRIDTVLLLGALIFVVEFKVGEKSFTRAALDQVWDYALDLKNFHAASHAHRIVPILVATDAKHGPNVDLRLDADGVFQPVPATVATFRDVVDAAMAGSSGEPVEARQWLLSPYRPTPTIVEAARALYAQHSVEAIARNDAGAQNLHATAQRIESIVEEAKRSRSKSICFVTGVPGAGKTLVGLNVATQGRDDHGAAPAVYLSGNGPLVAVLREALTRDEVERQKTLGMSPRKGKVFESVKAFIQNVHHFRDEALRDADAPAEHVAIFDEAQRAWTREQTSSFMRRKKNVADFAHSEPEFLISYMNRHTDWSVVVCLVGGGQEINTGEAGIDSWLDAVEHAFADWRMHISSRLIDSEYAAGRAIERVRHRPHTTFDDALHLSVSMRSFRSEEVSGFVKAVLDREVREAASIHERLADRYPIAVTRDLEAAKAWVRSRARGSERYGLVASSTAMRLKPHAIDVRAPINPVYWFLNEKDDTRSSYYLEDAATEFQVQGLELDWTCVTWDADLRSARDGWGYHDFRGTRWNNVRKEDPRRYLLNAYRVLLTRARQGMVIFVPPGSKSDPTRPPEVYDAMFEYLAAAGIRHVG